MALPGASTSCSSAGTTSFPARHTELLSDNAQASTFPTAFHQPRRHPLHALVNVQPVKPHKSGWHDAMAYQVRSAGPEKRCSGAPLQEAGTAASVPVGPGSAPERPWGAAALRSPQELLHRAAQPVVQQLIARFLTRKALTREVALSSGMHTKVSQISILLKVHKSIGFAATMMHE